VLRNVYSIFLRDHLQYGAKTDVTVKGRIGSLRHDLTTGVDYDWLKF
jgi:hypothetical protein